MPLVLKEIFMRKQKIFSILAVCLLALGLAFALTSCEMYSKLFGKEEETRHYLNFYVFNNYPDPINEIRAYSSSTSHYEPDNPYITNGTARLFNIWIADEYRNRSFEIRVYVSGQPGRYAATNITQADDVTYWLTLNPNGTLTRD
jgi:hypothetical protein